MAKKRKIVQELQADPRLEGECPMCQRTFSLRDALIVHVDDPLHPRIQEWRDKLCDEIAERRDRLKRRKAHMSEMIPKTTETVNRGKILEKIVPAYSETEYDLADYCALFDPIDYIVFDGVSSRGKIESVKFIDCKSGSAGLNQHQKQVKQAVEEERITLEIYREVRK